MDGFDINALDSLLSGNTTNEPVTQEVPPSETEPDLTPDDGGTDDTDGGGPDNLDSSAEPDQKNGADEGSKTQATQNAAFARLRTENKQLANTLQQLAQALGIQEKDPSRLSNALVEMAQNKLAKEANLPVEVYKELNQTKEEVAMLRYQQNQITAREKFAELRAEYELDDKALIKFAEALDQDGINVIKNPNVDLSYEYYKRNRKAIEEKKIAKAVEDALKKSNMADDKSSTPSKQKGKSVEPSAKVDNVSALDGLLSGK